MKKRVLIATTNRDKFSAVSKIFKETIFPKEEYDIDSLASINVTLKDEKEIGSNLERARQKAINAKKELDYLNFDYIVGLDDALRIRGEIDPNIRLMVNKIIKEGYLDDGEEYAFNRAYVIITKDGKMYETSADIPYIYRENKNAVIEEHNYPLSYVAYPLGYNVPVNELSEKEEIEYYLKYVKEPLMNLKDSML